MHFLLNLPRVYKKILIIIIDILTSFISVSITYFIFTFINLDIGNNDYKILFFTLWLIPIPISIFLGIYKILNRQSTILILSKIYILYFIILILFFFLDLLIEIRFLKIIAIIYSSIFIILFSLSRISIFLISKTKIINKEVKKLLFIYGVGEAGRYLISELEKQNSQNKIYYLDDDVSKQNMIFDGYKVLSPDSINNFIDSKFNIEVILAMPSLNKQRRVEIINKLNKKNVKVSSVPSLIDITMGKSLTNLNNIDLSDLLDHSSSNIVIDHNLYKDKIILITGAGGTIGGGLSERLLSLRPKKMILIDISEYNLFNNMNRLNALKDKLEIKTELTFHLISITSKEDLEKIFENNQINYVFHAAAYKHVHILEENIMSAVKNNILGTKLLCDLSSSYNVNKFLFVSSDKAVRPTNVLGACKRVSEIYVKAINDKLNNNTIFCSVRFGNVLGSSGSAFNTFIKQIENRETITLTSKEMTRYFMTIEESVDLLIKSLEISKGKELFILDMGSPYNIYNLIKKLISLYGLRIKDEKNYGDIHIQITGVRKGEKLYEELFIQDDFIKSIEKKIYVANEPSLEFDQIEDISCLLIEKSNQGNTKEIKKIFSKIVEGYKLNDPIV